MPFQRPILSSTSKKWDSIVWNFPYPPMVKGSVQPEFCRPLLEGVFANARKSLTKSGHIYVKLAAYQGGTSREVAGSNIGWDVESLASRAGLELLEVFPFEMGYVPKRAYEDSSFPCHGAKVHVLRVLRKTKAGQTPSKRNSRSLVASSIVDSQWALNSRLPVRWNTAMERLEPFGSDSPVATSLIEACAAFGEVERTYQINTAAASQYTSLSDPTVQTYGSSTTATHRRHPPLRSRMSVHLDCFRETMQGNGSPAVHGLGRRLL